MDFDDDDRAQLGYGDTWWGTIDLSKATIGRNKNPRKAKPPLLRCYDMFLLFEILRVEKTKRFEAWKLKRKTQAKARMLRKRENPEYVAREKMLRLMRTVSPQTKQKSNKRRRDRYFFDTVYRAKRLKKANDYYARKKANLKRISSDQEERQEEAGP